MTTNTQPTNKLAAIAATNKAVAAPVTSAAKPAGHNETATIKGLILSIVASLEIQKEEADAQKEIKAKLKADHGIEPKVASRVAKIMFKKNKAEIEELDNAVSALLDRLK